jgi:hypothetical protein
MNVASEIDKPILDPRSHPTWTVAGFILALLALVMSFVGMRNTTIVVANTQLEVLRLNQKLDDLKRVPAPTTPPVAAVQPQN